MNKYLPILSLFTLLSCTSENNTESTALNGTWAQCIPSVQTVDVAGSTVTTITGPSQEVITTYINNTSSKIISTHSDASCSNLTITREPILETFITGNDVTSNNGVLVTEIDITSPSGSVYKTIYLIQDSGSTLYFGKQCTLSNTPCTDGRSLEINYDLPSTRVK